MKTSWMTTTALAAVVTLGLAGCSDAGAGPGATAGSAADLAALATISWTVDDAGAPQLGFDLPLSVTSSAARLVHEGSGAEILLGDTIGIDYTVTSGTDGSVLYSTYVTQAPEFLPLADGSFDPVLLSVLVGHRVGSTIIYGSIDTTATDSSSIFLAITVNSTVTPLARAEGTPVAPVAGLPVVTLADNGAPSISIPGGDAPTDLISQNLIEGDGATVAAGQTITAHYTGWLWDGTEFDSSWGVGTPATFTLAADSPIIAGWVQGLLGKSVGSQVLLVIPPSLGYGDTDQGTIPAGSTLVFVVDILAVS